MSDFDLVFEKVRFKVNDVVNYYGRGKADKAKLRRVAMSILQRCRLGYRALEVSRNMKRKARVTT